MHIGSYIIGKLVEKVKSTRNIIVKTDTTVTDLLSEDDEIVGIVTDKSELIYADSTILTCGGFSFNREMIKKYRPDLENYPTTNGEWALGEGIQISSKIGADLIDMDKIQIHPTAFVDPKDHDNRTKVLAAELLRGIGGMLLNSAGNRFCNELGTRSYIVNKMNHSDGDIFYLMIPQKSYYQAEKMIDYYNKKGLLNRMTLEKIEKTYGIKKFTLESEINSYNKHSINRSDQFGKTNYPATPLDTSGEYYVGLVVPAIHYCMGGVAINKDAQVLNIRKEIIPRLYAAGEVTGGVHGDNRLGGNSLLECVVYGKIAGEQVVDIDPSSKTDKKKYITTGPIESDVEHLLLTKAIVAKHNKENDAWMIIHGKVYDVTDILSSHPGGKDSMLPYLGKDASEIFDSIHHASALSQVKLLGIISD
jgi:flavocytochrome c